MPTSTPVQFEPELLQASVQRLLAAEPECMYLTHYGRVGDVPRLGRAAARACWTRWWRWAAVCSTRLTATRR